MPTRQHTNLALLDEPPTPPIGIVDGPVDTTHPALTHTPLRTTTPPPTCTNPRSPACRHGTFVAGQLATLCPASSLILHPLFCEAATLEACPIVRPYHLATALDRLMDEGARIINMSVGLRGGLAGSMSALHRSYRRAEREGVLLIAAAGNDGHPDVNPLFHDPWVIPVAAHDPQGRILPTSNRGGEIGRHGLLAPGSELLGLAPGGGQSRMSGTSVAAPQVTATAALLWSQYPQATAAEIRRALLRPQVDRRGQIPPSLDRADSQRWLDALHHLHPATHHLHQPPTPTNRPTPMSPFTPPPTTSFHPTPRPTLEPAATASPSLVPASTIIPQACGCGCDPGPPMGFVYSSGTLAPHFANEGDRREFETRAREMERPVNDFFSILSKYRYLARRICWVLMVNERPTGILLPGSGSDLDEFIQGLGPEQHANYDVMVTGVRGSTAPPDKCDGLEVPMVSVAELNYFTQAALLNKLRDEACQSSGFSPSEIEQAINRVWMLGGIWKNPGFNDEQRAINFVALRNTFLYEKTVFMDKDTTTKYWLEALSAHVHETMDGRSVADVDATYENSNNQRRTFRAEVDVTDLFPFLSKSLTEV
ncbi:MAG: S8 family serine peptidase [Myxococcota bacterium]